MSQSQRSDSHSQYEEPFPHPPEAVPAVTKGQSGHARQERPPACKPRQSPPTPAEMRPGSIAAQDLYAATMLLMVGLPGAGKTTRAKELAAANRALRLTPDHWMIPLFGEPMADGMRFVLEGRLISVALQALRLGTSVVLDFGLWGRDERSALRWLARSAGAACQVIYLPVDKDVQLARIEQPGKGTASDVPDERGRHRPMAETVPGTGRRRTRRRRNPRSASGMAGLAGMGSRPLALMRRQLT
jgi:predicted kinase